MFYLEAQYENHDFKVTVNPFITRLLMSSYYFWAAESVRHRNGFCGTRRRIELMLTPWLSVPLAVGTHGGPQYLEMHLHLNSEFASNEFRTEFSLNLDLKSERYRRGLL